MKIRFWGTRGSIPKPGPETLRFGGNTSCVELQTRAGTRIILDCGSGAQDLGQALIAAGCGITGLLIHPKLTLWPTPAYISYLFFHTKDDTKLMQYLARQGFGYEDIKAAMQELNEAV